MPAKKNPKKKTAPTKEMPIAIKFLIAIVWDILDFTIFRIPAVGTATDILSIPLAVMLWGTAGLIASWEVIDITDQADSFVPTMTAIAIVTTFTGRKK